MTGFLARYAAFSPVVAITACCMPPRLVVGRYSSRLAGRLQLGKQPGAC
jgi:hypothetical protein